MTTNNQPRWRICGTGRNGPFTLTVRAADYADACRRGLSRSYGNRIQSVALLDEHPGLAREQAIRAHHALTAR